MTVHALPPAPITMPSNQTDEDDHDEIKVFKTEGDTEAASSQSADIIGDDKKDIGILAEQESSAASKPSGAPWNPAIGPSTSKLPPPPKAFRPTPKHPTSLPSTSGQPLPSRIYGRHCCSENLSLRRLRLRDTGSPMSVYVPGAFPPNFCFFPMTQGTWNSGQGLSAASPLYFPLAGRIAGAGGSGGPPPPAHAGAIDPAKFPAWSPSFPGLGHTPGISPHFPTPAGLSPSYEALFPLHMAHMAQMQRNFSPLAGAPSPQTNFSPLPSPNTGTPIQVQPAKAAAQAASEHMMQQMMAVSKLAMQQNGINLPPSFHQRLQFSGGNPLMSLGSLSVPQVSRSVTSLATSLAAETSGRDRSGKRDSRDREPRSRHSDKEHHIKKPLNAFMLFMKENRAKMQEQKGFKERQSAELNKEMGRMWHLLSQEEQQKYYQMAKEERQRHQQQFPGWSARDNYAIHKKKKRKRDKIQGDPDSLELKKCRARFGLDNQAKWCKHCKRKKKCLWFREGPHNGHHGEQSPAQVSSTTQGSPQESETSTTSSLAHLSASAALHLHKLPGQPPSKLPRLTSPSSIVSSTTHHKSSEKDELDSEVSDDSGEEDSEDEEGPEDLSAPSPPPDLLLNNNKPPPLPTRPLHLHPTQA